MRSCLKWLNDLFCFAAECTAGKNAACSQMRLGSRLHASELAFKLIPVRQSGTQHSRTECYPVCNSSTGCSTSPSKLHASGLHSIDRH